MQPPPQAMTLKRDRRTLGAPVAGLPPSGQARPSGGFTLIELILVMSLMLIVVSLIGPSLSRFFRGRTLDSEARRFMTLTRYAQSRSVSEGIPILIWVDVKLRRYGIEAEPSFLANDPQAREYQVAENLQIEVERNRALATASGLGASVMNSSAPAMTGAAVGLRNAQVLRFLPDGSISETSPNLITLRETAPDGSLNDPQASSLAIGQSLNRMHYEIQTNQLASYRR